MLVVVPARPGAVTRLGDVGGRRDDLDELLDDVFGEPDDRGPGPVDAVLLVGGAAAIVVGSVTSAPAAVTVVGAIAAALGAVLPARALWRRVADGGRSRRLRALV